MKPLFIPLKSGYYEEFKNGEKGEEFRLYGPRWNHGTCVVGREVILSKGYGKKSRMKGIIWKFQKIPCSKFNSPYKEEIRDVYGSLDADIAVISIMNLMNLNQIEEK